MNNLKELANKHIKIHKMKDTFGYLLLFSTFSFACIIGFFIAPKKNSVFPIYIFFISIISFIFVSISTINIILAGKQSKNAKQINEILKQDSQTNYIQDTNRVWTKEIIEEKKKRRKKQLLLFSLAPFVSISAFIPSLIYLISLGEIDEFSALAILAIIFTIISSFSILIFSIFLFLSLTFRVKKIEIQGYLLLLVYELGMANVYLNRINKTPPKSKIFSLTLPNNNVVIYVGGAIFPANLIDKAEIK